MTTGNDGVLRGEFMAPLVVSLGRVVVSIQVSRTFRTARVTDVIQPGFGRQVSRISASTVKACDPSWTGHVSVMARVVNLETLRDLPVLQLVGHPMSGPEASLTTACPKLGVTVLADPARPTETFARSVVRSIVRHLFGNGEATGIDPRRVLVPQAPTSVIVTAAQLQSLVDSWNRTVPHTAFHVGDRTTPSLRTQ